MKQARPLVRRHAGRFGGRPHVGVVTHFDALDVEEMVARLRAVAGACGISLEGMVEEVEGRRLFSAAAPVPGGDGFEIWIVATEQPAVGCKVETRVFHAVEQSAHADEYLAAFAQRLAGARPADQASRKDAS